MLFACPRCIIEAYWYSYTFCFQKSFPWLNVFRSLYRRNKCFYYVFGIFDVYFITSIHCYHACQFMWVSPGRLTNIFPLPWEILSSLFWFWSFSCLLLLFFLRNKVPQKICGKNRKNFKSCFNCATRPINT